MTETKRSAIAAIRLYQPMVNLSVNEGTFHMGHRNYTLKLHIHEHRSRNQEHIELQWVRDCKIWQDRHATPVELFKREGVKFPDTKHTPSVTRNCTNGIKSIVMGNMLTPDSSYTRHCLSITRCTPVLPWRSLSGTRGPLILKLEQPRLVKCASEAELLAA